MHLPDGRSPLTAPLEEAPPRGRSTASVHDERLDGDAALVRERLGLPSLRQALPDSHDAAAEGRRAHLRRRRCILGGQFRQLLLLLLLAPGLPVHFFSWEIQGVEK